MVFNRRQILLGSASTILFNASLTKTSYAQFFLEEDISADQNHLLVLILQTMFPHKNFPEAPYRRTADLIFKNANKTTTEKILFSVGLDDLEKQNFAKRPEGERFEVLKSIEGTPFFEKIRLTAINTLYNDHEVWQILGYEGPSFDKGGYIHRGFNDLTWLPEPRIAEYEGE